MEGDLRKTVEYSFKYFYIRTILEINVKITYLMSVSLIHCLHFIISYDFFFSFFCKNTFCISVQRSVIFLNFTFVFIEIFISNWTISESFPDPSSVFSPPPQIKRDKESSGPPEGQLWGQPKVKLERLGLVQDFEKRPKPVVLVKKLSIDQIQRIIRHSKSGKNRISKSGKSNHNL